MANFLDIVKERRKLKGLSQADVATKLGVTLRQYQRMEAGGTPIKLSHLKSLKNIVPLTRNELVTYMGLPLTEKSPFDSEEVYNQALVKEDKEEMTPFLGEIKDSGYTQHMKNSGYWKGVPIFDTPVSAGMLSLIRDETAPEPAYYLAIPSFKDCKFGARVTGDSMYPEIRSGDFVILKEVVDFIYGDIYLVVTMDGQETVKRVYPHDEDPNKINLVPSNKEIPVTPILKSNIIKILKVKGVIKGY